jgi:probable HAF family extracellular repeat protein
MHPWSEVIMRTPVPGRCVVFQLALSLALVAEAACRGDRPVSPAVPDPSFAKGGPSSDPTVTSTTPSSASPDTTLNVTVAGSGFEPGSKAVWALDGDTAFAKTKVKTNSTRYVSAKQLVANITISADASVDLYDVHVVTLSGRKGIGIELFAVAFGITDIGAGDVSTAYAVNSAGRVAGTIEPPLNSTEPGRAFVWTPSSPFGTTGTLRDIGTLGGAGAHAKATNEAGHVVGGAGDAAGVSHAYLWTAVGGMKSLGFPAGATSAGAWGMNDIGDVVGIAENADSQYAVWWRVSVAADGSVQVGSVEALAPVPGSFSTVAFAVNQRGQAVGWSIPISGSNHPIMWTRTSDGWIVEDLGILPGDAWAVARDINDAGIAVGYSHPGQGCASAVVWTTQAGRTTGRRALPSLGGCGSEAYGINNQGDVVGRSTNAKGQAHAVLWKIAPDGAPLGVTDLGVPTASVAALAYDVSPRVGGVAQITGLVWYNKGARRATLWRVQ